MFYYSFTDIQVEETAQNIANAFDIPYTDVLSRIGITEETLITAVDNLLETIIYELQRSLTVQNLKTVWRLLWAGNFVSDTFSSGGEMTPGKYYYLCINNSRLKCIRDKAVEMYNMKRSELTPPTTHVEEKKALPKKKEAVVVATEDVSAEVPEVAEKKKRAPAKKKEAVVVASVEDVSAEVPEVVEKKKRAPAKKKEAVVVASVEDVSAEVPEVVEKKKRAPAKKKEAVVVA